MSVLDGTAPGSRPWVVEGLRASLGTYTPRSISEGGMSLGCLQKGIAKADKDSLH